MTHVAPAADAAVDEHGGAAVDRLDHLAEHGGGGDGAVELAAAVVADDHAGGACLDREQRVVGAQHALDAERQPGRRSERDGVGQRGVGAPARRPGRAGDARGRAGRRRSVSWRAAPGQHRGVAGDDERRRAQVARPRGELAGEPAVAQHVELLPPAARRQAHLLEREAARIDTTGSEAAASTPATLARSASGWASPCSADGAGSTGARGRTPASSIAVSTSRRRAAPGAAAGGARQAAVASAPVCPSPESPS